MNKKKYIILSVFLFVFISLACGDKKKDDPASEDISFNKVATTEKVASKEDKPTSNKNSFDGSQLTDWLKRCVVSLEQLVATNVKEQTTGVKVSKQSVAEIAAAVNANNSRSTSSASFSESSAEEVTRQSTDDSDISPHRQNEDDEETESYNDSEDRRGQFGNSHFSRDRDAEDVRDPKVLPDPLFNYAEWQEAEIENELIISQYITQKDGQPKCYYIKNPAGGDKVLVVVCDVLSREGFSIKKSEHLMKNFDLEFKIQSYSIRSDATTFVIISREPIFSEIHFGNVVFSGNEKFLKKLSPNKTTQSVKWKIELGGSYNEILYCYVVVAVNEIQGGKTLYYKIFPIKFLTQYTEEFYRQ